MGFVDMRTFTLFCLFCLSVPVFADTLGFRAGVGLWDYTVTGDIRDSVSPSNKVDLTTDLHIKDDQQSFSYIYFEHPIPLLPNIRLSNTKLTLNGSGPVSKEFTFNGQLFTSSFDLTTNIDLSHSDITLYYEIIDILFDFDIGITAKVFNGYAELISVEGTTVQSIDATVPLLYANLAVDFGGLDISAELNYLNYDKFTILENIFRVRYTTSYLLGVEVGYRSLYLDIADNDNSLYSNIDINGPYAGLSFKF